MLAASLAASILTGLISGPSAVSQDGQKVFRRVKVLSRSSQAVFLELSSAPSSGITFSSCDPTDNSIVIGGTASSVDACIARIQVLQKGLDSLWELNARKTYFGAGCYLEFVGPGHFDAGADTITLSGGGTLKLKFRSQEDVGYVVTLFGKADKDVLPQIGVDGEEAQSVKLNPDEKGGVVLRAILPPRKRDILAEVRCSIGSGKLEVDRVLVQQTRN
jgi:hypothetical protein